MPALEGTTELFRLLSDPTRLRLLSVLSDQELTVAELTGVTQLGQSRVSTHLGKLRDAQLVRDRRHGAATFYALNQGGMSPDAERLWQLAAETLHDAVLEEDRRRARDVVAARARGVSWADAVAGQMERHYSPGRTWDATARGLLGLCRLGRVLDVASGDGALATLIAPHAARVTCLDRSKRVLAAARKRLAKLPNVDLRHGDMHQLPFDDATFDAVMLMSCLTYAEDPRQVLREAARVARPGAILVGVTLKRHSQDATRSQYNHVNLGFEPAELRSMLRAAGFAVRQCDVTSREARPPHFEVITFSADAREAATQ